jgi:hypothetical protein
MIAVGSYTGVEHVLCVHAKAAARWSAAAVMSKSR